MKTKLFQGLLCSLLLAFTFGCGKENSSGGGGPVQNTGLNPIVNPGIDQLSEANLNEIKAWYNNAEPTDLRPYSKLTRNITSQQQDLNSGCAGETKKILGFFEICIYGEIEIGNGNTSQEVFLVLDPGVNGSVNNPYVCKTNNGFNCSEAAVMYSGKAQNVRLLESINGRNNTLVLLGVTKLSSTVYQLVYTNSSTETQPSVIYKIDTAQHSLYNPVEMVDLKAAQPIQEWVQFLQ